MFNNLRSYRRFGEKTDDETNLADGQIDNCYHFGIGIHAMFCISKDLNHPILPN
jgi:hypothetical protein